MTQGSAAELPSHSKTSPDGQASSSMPVENLPARSAFWPVFWFAAVAVGAKAVLLEASEAVGTGDWLVELARVAQSDVGFALAAGLIAQGALSLCKRWPRPGHWLWIGLLGLCGAGVAYSVASVPLLRFLRAPLTFSLIDILGGLGALPGLAIRFMTFKIGVALGGILLAYLIVAVFSDRFLQPRRSALVRAAQFVGLGLVLWYIAIARQPVAGGWRPSHGGRLLTLNPHYALLTSGWKELRGKTATRCRGRFDEEDLEDFRIVAQRPDKGQLFTPLSGQRPENVILVVLGSVSTRGMSLYGGQRSTTPRLEEEAAFSLVCQNIHTAVPNASHALASLTLSTYAPLSWHPVLHQEMHLPGTALARTLRARGYRTAFLTLGRIQQPHDTALVEDRGFDAIWDFDDLSGLRPPSPPDAGRMIDTALTWMGQQGKKPFFMMLWSKQVRRVETPPATQPQSGLSRRKSETKQYLEDLRALDAHIGRLLDALRQRNLAQKTLVVIVGDHGRSLGVPHAVGRSQLYQEFVNVPCIFWNPALFGRMPRSNTVGSLIDVNPTVLDILAVPLPYRWQGHSLLSKAHPGRAYLHNSKDGYLLGLREGDYKYICNTTADTEELYDLSTDPEEQINLAPDHPEACARLRQRLAAWMHYQLRVER